MTIQQQLSISFWWVKTNQLKKWYPIFPIPGEDFTRFPKSGTRPTYALSPSRSYDPYDVLSCSWDLPSYWAWVITGAKSHGDTLVTQHWNSSLFQLPPGDFTWPCWLNYASSQWYPTGDTLPHAPCTCETCWVASLPRCLKGVPLESLARCGASENASWMVHASAWDERAKDTGIYSGGHGSMDQRLSKTQR